MNKTNTKAKRPVLGSVFEQQQTEVKAESGAAEQGNRAGLTSTPFWIPIPAKRQMRMLAAELETTQQGLMREALNMIFKKHGKPPIA